MSRFELTSLRMCNMSLPNVIAGSSAQGFRPAMPLSAPSSQSQGTPAQPSHPLPHLNQQPTVQKPSAGPSPFDAAAAAASGLQAPGPRLTSNLQSSTTGQQPQSRAWQQSMSMPGSLSANSHHRPIGQQVLPRGSGHGMSQQVGSYSSANHGVSSSTGNAMPAAMSNGIRPTFPGGLSGSATGYNVLGPQAHGSSATKQPVGLPAPMTHQQQSVQNKKAGKAAAGGDAPGNPQSALHSDASEMPGRPLMPEEAAAGEVGKAGDGLSNGPDSDAHQHEAARSDVHHLAHLPDAPDLIEPNMLAGGEGPSHDLLAD